MKNRFGVIYMLKNKVNNKMYIGQTMRDLNVRIERHIKDAKYGSDLAIHRAIRKYGIDNFDIIVLEKDISEEKLNEREIYFIKKYNSVKLGYNLSYGGDGGKATRYSDEQILEVKKLLRDTDLAATEISRKTGVSIYMVRDINRGKSLLTKDFPTPIRDIKPANRLTKKEIEEIQKLLQLKQYKLSQIAKKYNCALITVSRINSGLDHYSDKLSYPLMPVNNIRAGCHPEEKIKEIMYLLSTTNLNNREIAEKIGVSDYDVNDINLGKTWKHLWDGEYPIRKFDWKTEEQVNQVIDLIINTELSLNAISEITGVSRSVCYTILNGKHKYCKDKNLAFPLERQKVKEKENIKINTVIDLYVNQGLSIDVINKKTGICRDFIRGVINGTYSCMKDRDYNYPLIKGSKKV